MTFGKELTTEFRYSPICLCSFQRAPRENHIGLQQAFCQNSAISYPSCPISKYAICYPLSVICYPPSAICHQLSPICNPLSAIPQPPSTIRHPAFIIRHTLSIIVICYPPFCHPPSAICYLLTWNKKSLYKYIQIYTIIYK